MQIFKTGLILLVFSLSGCSSPPEKPEPPPPEKKPEPIKVECPPTAPKPSAMLVEAMINVSADVNPDIDSRPSPVVVRIYELKKRGKYKQADFYELFDNFESVLGADLLGSEQFHLNPGDNRTLKHDISPETQYIAVTAAFRDINQAVWRDSIVIPAVKKTQLLILVDKLSISVWKK